MDYLRSVMLAIYISLSILIIASNLAIIFVIVYSSALRKLLRNHMMISMAMADLLMGSFVTPMLAATLIESSVADCHTHIAVQILGDYGIFFVVGWELVTFNIRQLQNSFARFQWSFLPLPPSTCLKSTLLVLWPWFAAVCVLVPLIVASTPIKVVYYIYGDVMCMMRLPRNILITVCFFSLYLPFCLCLLILAAAVTCYSRGYHRQPSTILMEERNPNPQDEIPRCQRTPPRQSLENPLLLTIPNMTYLVCYLPLIVHTCLYFNEIHIHHAPYGVIVFAVLARSVILPVSWLVYTDIRQELTKFESGIKRTFSLCFRNPVPSMSSTVSFSRLQEAHGI